MRISHLVVGLVAGARIVAANNSTVAYPSCAVQCVLEALPKSSCPGLDQACLCNDTEFTKHLAPCLKDSCSTAERINMAKSSAGACGVKVSDDRALPRFLTGILFILPTAFIGIRIANKIMNPSIWGADDITAVLGYICTLPLVPIIYRSLDIGLGDAVWNVEPSAVTEFFKMLFASQVLYLTGLMVIKASILFFFLRIFPAPGVRKILWATQAVNFVVGLVYVSLTFAQCRPLSMYWTGWDKDHSQVCFDFNKLILTHASINIAMDVWMLILPLTQLYKLNLVLRKKVGVMLMFSVGLFLAAVSAIRIHTMVRFMKASNVTSEALWVYVWTFTELCVGVFVACLPSAGHLWRTLFVKPETTTFHESKSRRQSSYASEAALFPSNKQGDNSVGSVKEVSVRGVPQTPPSPHSMV
ncbi:CFEM domain-containing protein [Colletotrichum truncatum]|uniref:CFEM domain-containing protein n=1 Tax=Colletotrichum truncatum TaxID=5467 RepID=A0ACC3YHF4_COLTU|nr:CFEM domain-containing protein [Colletotrichum truncatum]KAF6792863.1 CFEM domain-containing protein [Colletotrichum truncatum]